MLAKEMKRAIGEWFTDLQQKPSLRTLLWYLRVV